ncbi:hypothetical protein KQS06HV_100324 [Klebsiella quasipneumoniae subsp. similipneumoniae]|nr:hypothetical protein KQS06HV_100324 [Klebsiella quasipneumoniae subsp. similipneumoniae]
MDSGDDPCPIQTGTPKEANHSISQECDPRRRVKDMYTDANRSRFTGCTVFCRMV